MYLPAHFKETRVEVLHQLMRNHALAVLVTLGSEGLNANHIPFELDPEPSPYGTLRGHVARANTVWRDLSSDVEALVVFQGAASYISPSWYSTKKETGKVVPTWNYAAVHAYGPLQIIEDRNWLHGLVERLTNQHEAATSEPWKITDAPSDYIETLLGAIVGIEISISKLIGKWKVSQNQNQANRESVVAELSKLDDENAVAMADLIKQHLK